MIVIEHHYQMRLIILRNFYDVKKLQIQQMIYDPFRCVSRNGLPQGDQGT